MRSVQDAWAQVSKQLMVALRELLPFLGNVGKQFTVRLIKADLAPEATRRMDGLHASMMDHRRSSRLDQQLSRTGG